MQLEQRIVDNVAIVKITGDITLSKGERSELAELATQLL